MRRNDSARPADKCRRPINAQPGRSHRFRLTGGLAAIVLAIAASVAFAQNTGIPQWGAPPAALPTAPAETAAEQKKVRIREGSDVKDRLGYFRMTGSRVTFFDNEGDDRLVGLENLNLERIAQVVGDNPVQLVWSVSGVVTEYQGDNYILITRAVLSKPDGDKP